MMKQTIGLGDELYRYLLNVSLRENEVKSELRSVTSRLEMGRMQISPDQGQFMALLVKILQARRVIEIGTFTGYSALCMAESLPEDGKLVACDISSEWTDIGKPYWVQAGVADKIDLKLAPAIDTLDSLIASGQKGSYDMAFIDADKINQINYYQRCIELIRGGGLIAIDNVLWGGSVTQLDDTSEDTVAIRLFNEFLAKDSRVDISLVPIGDGLTLALKH